MRHALLLLAAASFSAPTSGRAQSSAPIHAAENPGGRVYLEGRPVDAILLPDGSVGYLLERPPSGTRPDPDGPWVLIAHPVRGRTSTSIDPITRRRVVIGTDPDGTYHGFAWFAGRVPDVVESDDGTTTWTPVYETDPSRIAEWRAGRTTPSATIEDAAVQRWWAGWDDWLENLRAGNLVPHSGVVSGCREREDGTVVTMKGDGTFQFLCRNRDRITYEGPEASDPCAFVGRRVTVWTLPCDDGPCIRKIQATVDSDAPATPLVSEPR